MSIKFAGVKDNFTHKWPDGCIEEYEAISYKVYFDNKEHDVVIGFTERKAYGKTRRRIIVFIDGKPEAEFVATDDYDYTGHLVAIIKTPEGKLMDISRIHSEYIGLPVVEHARHINKSLGGKSGKAALIVTADDHKTIIKHAIIQSKWRKAKYLQKR